MAIPMPPVRGLYQAPVVNLWITGEEWSAPLPPRHLGIIQLRLDGLPLEIYQSSWMFSGNQESSYWNKKIRSTVFCIADLPEPRFEDAQDIVRHLCELLSFAACSEVAPSGYRYPTRPNGGANYGFAANFFQSKAAILRNDGKSYRVFIQRSWHRYRRLREKRRLEIAISYFTESNKQKALELRLIVTFVLLEHLKHTYAACAQYPYIKGYYRIRGATSKKDPRKEFEPLLSEMLREVGMYPGLGRIVRLRNEIIHSGLSTLSPNEMWSIYGECQDILREYFLRLLGYKGPWLPFTANFPVVM